MVANLRTGVRMKILVAYIATAGGRDAVALGATLAGTFGAELEICVVLPPEPDNPTEEVERLSDTLDATAQGWLDEAAALVHDGIPTTTSVAVHANPAGGLIERAEDVDAGLLVIGGSGGGIVGRHTLGTVVNDILHSSPVPVALAPLGFSHTGPERIGRLSTALGMRPGAGHLVDTIVDFCQAGKVPLRLVSLVALDDMDHHRGRGIDDAVAHARTHIDKATGEISARLPETVPVTSAVVQGDSIEEAVAGIDWADDDVIVVGSSRLAAPRRIFLGTTAAKMLRVLAIPMIVVPSTAQ